MVVPGISNGRYCMQRISADMERMSPDISLADLCHKLTETIRGVYNSYNIDIVRLSANPVERLTASVVVYSDYYRQIWMIGDCRCLVAGKLYDNGKPIEAVLAARRSAFLNDRLSEGISTDEIQKHDIGRDTIIDDIIKGCKKQNIEYPVIDGFDVALNKVKIIDVPRDVEVVLASDGYPFLCDTLAESEDALARQLREDPLCISSFKATKGLMHGNKSFDDRCYIRFKTD